MRVKRLIQLESINTDVTEYNRYLFSSENLEQMQLLEKRLTDLIQKFDRENASDSDNEWDPNDAYITSQD